VTKAFGLARGKIFPAKRAGSLLNPVRRLIQSPTRTVERMALAQTDKVLEIGCGPGYFSRAIAAAVPQGSLVLFDLQLAMLEIARRRLPEFANIHFTQVGIYCAVSKMLNRYFRIAHRLAASANIVLPDETACSAMRNAAAFQDCPGIPRGASVFP
jgi:SAM-dependent methyltransferase